MAATTKLRENISGISRRAIGLCCSSFSTNILGARLHVDRAIMIVSTSNTCSATNTASEGAGNCTLNIDEVIEVRWKYKTLFHVASSHRAAKVAHSYRAAVNGMRSS